MSTGRDGGKTGDAATYAATGVDVVGLEPGLGSLVQRPRRPPRSARRTARALPNVLLRQRPSTSAPDRGSRSAPTASAPSYWRSRSRWTLRHHRHRPDRDERQRRAVRRRGLIAVVDYIAISTTDRKLLATSSRRVRRRRRARRASASLAARSRRCASLLVRTRRTASFDVVATAVGVVPMDRIVVGRDVKPGGRR